jgi:DNA-binding NarL/FixJ family response regulator
MTLARVPTRHGGQHLEKIVTAESVIRILIVDDHPVLRQGLAALISAESDLKLVAEAANGREAIQQFRTHRPDVTLMDLQMPEMGGIDAIGAIRAEFPDAHIIVLTTYAGDAHAMRALKAGARAYLLKNTLHRELVGTVRAVRAGRKNLSPEVSFLIAEHVSDDPLSPAEIRVLRLISEGKANKEIAIALSLKEETVKAQVRSILSKLGVKDRTHAAMVGLKRGIIEF